MKRSSSGLPRTIQLWIQRNSLDQFYERVMTPVMSEIGYMWSEGKLSIATEHVASNIAHSLVKVISDENRKSKKDNQMSLKNTIK